MLIYGNFTERKEYIQGQISKIRNLVEERQSQIAWQTINEVSKRRSTSKAKLKASSQEKHFMYLLITKIINSQLDIKL